MIPVIIESVLGEGISIPGGGSETQEPRRSKSELEVITDFEDSRIDLEIE